jgi:hypothetical protein
MMYWKMAASPCHLCWKVVPLVEFCLKELEEGLDGCLSTEIAKWGFSGCADVKNLRSAFSLPEYGHG